MSIPTLLKRYRNLLGVIAFFVIACNLAGTEKTKQTFSFTKTFDTLAQFDSVRITLRDTAGHTIDILYHGKADTIHEVENLSAPHWNGSGIAVVSVVGFQSGEEVYHVDRKFNGKNDAVLDTLRLILPGTTLNSGTLSLELTEGDSIPLPIITVTPSELSDKSLTFASSAPELLFIGNAFLRALQRGTVELTATLKSNPNKSLKFVVRILANPLTPDNLQLSPDTLRVAANGAMAELKVRVSPATADAGAIFTLRDGNVAMLVDEGWIQGLKAGQTWVISASKRKLTVRDSSLILVSAPIPVSQVRFKTDSLLLFVGGAAESLLVDVIPPLANPKVNFQIGNPILLALVNGRMQGLVVGNTSVVVQSAENPSLADTLKISVVPAQSLDSVRVKPDSLVLFTGGPAGTLTGAAFPSAAFQGLQWITRNPVVANVDGNGKVMPIASGKTRVIAHSRVDSTKLDSALITVKRDMPQVTVGRDTVVAKGSTLVFRPKVTQEFGTVVQFRWDLNGDGIWEGSSDSVKSVSFTYNESKEFVAAFNVKDSEGNDTTAYQKVKTVSGPAVQILSPLDSSYTREFTTDVVWTVNGKEQDSLKKQTLKLGANTVTRSAKDEAGNTYFASITVTVDTLPPNKPLLHGPAVTISQTPTWTWSTGGSGGSGNYKYWLDVDDSSKGKEIKDTAFTPATQLAEGVHTLFVAERDKASNWSQAGRLAIKIDLTGPGTPKPKAGVSTQSNNKRPTWVWLSGGGGSDSFRVKIDDADMSKGTIAVSGAQFTSPMDLGEGGHSLYVQESDSAGNWSQTGSIPMLVDLTAPKAPTFTSVPLSPINTLRPSWSWKTGGGGIGKFRYRMDASDLSTGATVLADAQLTNPIDLSEGRHTIYVQETDSAGNWSAATSASVVVAQRGPVGKAGFTPGGGYLASMNFASNNQLYLAYQDESRSSKISVQRFDGASWRPLGPEGFSEKEVVGNTALELSPTNVPYVAFPIEYKVVVARFNGNDWEQIASQSVASTYVSYLSMALKNGNQPYIAYSDPSDSDRAVVKAWNGSSWESIGVGAISEGAAIRLKLKIDPIGTPIIAFRDGSRNEEVVVKRLEGTSWKSLGGLSSSAGRAFAFSMDLDQSGKPVIAYEDSSQNGRLVVKKYNGSGWENVGAGPVSFGAINSVVIANIPTGQPVVSYSDATSSGKLRTYLFDGGVWLPMGATPESDGSASFLAIAVNSSGIPYTAFTDGTRDNKITVVKSAFEQ